MDKDRRRFACTACGACCTQGPEMELGETIALADIFRMSLLYRLHAVPIDAKADWARRWWIARESRIPLQPALDEAHRHLATLATRKFSDRRRQSRYYLQISAVVDRTDRGKCPALQDNLCGIYERRPITCRTVPLHYSRAPSTLRAALDRFTRKDDHHCVISDDAPVILDGNKVVDPPLLALREAGVAQAKSDRPWKDGIVRLMEADRGTGSMDFPTLEQALSGLKNGSSLKMPIVAAWRVARDMGTISAADFARLCRDQLRIIRRDIADALVADNDPAILTALRMATTGAEGPS